MLLRGATLLTLDPPAVAGGDLRVDGDRIVERGDGLTPLEGEAVEDLAGRYVMPGLVNGHTHLYGSLGLGMPGPRSKPRRLLETLERVWWRYDLALDAEAVSCAATIGAIDAALSGTTLVIDHHSSPSVIDGSLVMVRDALERVGIRSVLCYEVSDRNGLEGRDAGIEENVTFQHHHQSALTRGMVGAQASRTLSDESLERLAGAVERTGSSLHLHVAEDRADVEDCRTRYGVSPPERLYRHGLVMSRTILAHCVHLAPEQITEVNERGGWVAHAPRSNMRSAVGHAPPEAWRRAALGTDGVDQDMLAELKGAFFRMREGGRTDAASTALGLLAGGHRLAAALFGRPFGKLDAGGPADLVVLDYAPATPLDAENLASHLLFAVNRSHVQSVMVAGRWIARDRRLEGVDAAAERAHARELAPRIWERAGLRPAQEVVAVPDPEPAS